MGKSHRISVLRSDDNLQIIFFDALADDEKPGSIRLDVDKIFRKSAEQYDTKKAFFEEIASTKLAGKPEAPRLQQIQDDPYPPSDRLMMRQLLSTWGYRAGEHMRDKQGWSDATELELKASPIVSSYVLYEIGIYGIGRAVLPLNWFQQGRACASHAAPFDAKFRIQANLAIAGGFFEGNMNAKMGDAVPTVRKDLPWKPQKMLWSEDPGFPVQELEEAGKLDVARKHMVLTSTEGEAFLLRHGEWLPSWLGKETDAALVDIKTVVDGDGDEVLSVKTPKLGEQTKFLLHGVRHVNALKL